MHPYHLGGFYMATSTFERIMQDFFPALLDGLDAAHNALQKYDEASIGRTLTKLDGMHGDLHKLVERLVAEAKTNPNAACRVPVTLKLEHISRYMVRIATSIKAKNADQILFSDLAHKELDYLMERTRDVLVHTRDYVMSPSDLGAQHITKVQALIERAATESATKHEERLIEGLCLPVASSLFLDILDALKAMAWYAKEVSATRCE